MKLCILLLSAAFCRQYFVENSCRDWPAFVPYCMNVTSADNLAGKFSCKTSA